MIWSSCTLGIPRGVASIRFAWLKNTYTGTIEFYPYPPIKGENRLRKITTYSIIFLNTAFCKLEKRNTFQIRITSDRAQVIQKGAQKSKAHFFGLIIRFAFGIRAFFCCLGYYPSQKVESLWFKLYLVGSGTPFNGFLTQGHRHTIGFFL